MNLDKTSEKELKSFNIEINIDSSENGEIKPALPSTFRIFKAGLNTSITNGDVLFDEIAFKACQAFYFEHGQSRLPIDYEHCSTAVEKRPGDGRAAGWFTPLFTEQGELWADQVEWTLEAQAMLLDKQYAYYSPTFYTDRDNRIIALLCLALTNLPATDNLNQLIQASMTLENANEEQAQAAPIETQEFIQDDKINEYSILIESKDAQIKEYSVKLQELALVNGKLEAQLKEYDAQIKGYQVQIAEKELERVLEDAIKESRIVPAQLATLRSIGQLDISLLKELLDSSPTLNAFSNKRIEQGQVLETQSKLNLTPDQWLELSRKDPATFEATYPRRTNA